MAAKSVETIHALQISIAIFDESKRRQAFWYHFRAIAAFLSRNFGRSSRKFMRACASSIT